MKNHTEIICVLDKSGSMDKIKTDAIGGFNTFLKSQKELKESASLTLALFSNRYNLELDNVSLDEVPELTEKTFSPSGTTALYDSIGRTMNMVGKRLANTDESERPNKILFIILTDGDENASRTFSKEKISEMISHQRDVYNWEFVFLAANQDAMKTASTISISGGNAMNFGYSSEGVSAAYKNLSSMTGRLRKSKVNFVNGNLFNSDEQNAGI